MKMPDITAFRWSFADGKPIKDWFLVYIPGNGPTYAVRSDPAGLRHTVRSLSPPDELTQFDVVQVYDDWNKAFDVYRKHDPRLDDYDWNEELAGLN